MINPKELRIGNWMLRSDGKDIGTLSYIQIASINDIDKVIRDVDEGGYTYLDIRPISLTPEILQKIGFIDELDNDRPWLPGSDYEYHLDTNELHFRTSTVKVNFVHQFQNIHFALTGEELKIEL